MPASDIDTSEWGIIKSLVRKYQVGISRVAVIAFMMAVVVYLALAPIQEFIVTGRVVRLTGNGMDVSVDSGNLPSGFSIPIDFISVSQGICFADPAFGQANCRLGAHVELIRFNNRAGMEWWYVTAVFEPTGGVPDVPSTEKTSFV